MKNSIITIILLAGFTVSVNAQHKKEEYQAAFLELVNSAENDFTDLLGEKGTEGETETLYGCTQPIFGKLGYFIKDADGLHFQMEIKYRSEAKKMAKVVNEYIAEILKTPMYRRYFNDIRTDIYRTAGETAGSINRYLRLTVWDDYHTGFKTLILGVYGKSIKNVADPNFYTGRYITAEQLQQKIAETPTEPETPDPKRAKTLTTEDMNRLINSNSPTQAQQNEATRHKNEMDKQASDTEKLKKGTWNGH